MNEFSLAEATIKYVNEIPLHFRILIYYSVLSYFITGRLTRKWAEEPKKYLEQFRNTYNWENWAKERLNNDMIPITIAFVFAPITLLVFVLWKIIEKTFLFLRYLAVGDIKE